MRQATLLWYMSEVGGGGETFFPRSGGLRHPPDVLCEGGAGWQGMRVTPSKGKAVLFYSLRPCAHSRSARRCALLGPCLLRCCFGSCCFCSCCFWC